MKKKLFLKAFSWETYPWVKLGDFTVKKAKLGREICIQLKIDKVEETKCCVRKIITIICVTCVQNNANFNWTLVNKISHFNVIDPNFTHSQKNVVFKV